MYIYLVAIHILIALTVPTGAADVTNPLQHSMSEKSMLEIGDQSSYLAPLVGGDLKNIFSGRIRISPDASLPKAFSGAGDEMFDPSGLYEVRGHHARLTGKFEVRNDSFCVLIQNVPTSCRKLYKDDSGEYYVQDLDRENLNIRHVVLEMIK